MLNLQYVYAYVLVTEVVCVHSCMSIMCVAEPVMCV